MSDGACNEASSLTVRVTNGDGSQMLAFAGQETRTTIGVTNASFTLRVTDRCDVAVGHAMVTRRVSEEAAE